MDSLKFQWNKFISEDSIYNTTKIFFGKYFYRAEFCIPAVHLSRYIGEYTYDRWLREVLKHQKYAKEYLSTHESRAESWTRRIINSKQEILNCNPEQIYSLHTICNRYKSQGLIRTRIENSHFQIYAMTEKDLFDIILELSSETQKLLISIHRPINEDIKIKLRNNSIFVRKAKFKFKVEIRDGIYQTEVRQQIYQYLKNFPNDIHVPRRLSRYLTEANSYVRGSFFVDDTTNLTFLSIISPTFVRNIFKLEQLAE